MRMNIQISRVYKLAILTGALFSLLLGSCAISTLSETQQRTPPLFDEDAYLLYVFCDLDTSTPSWGMPKKPFGPYDEGETALDVIKHFSKQPEEQRKRGIFIHSFSYRVPDTEMEKRIRPAHEKKLYYDEAWRKAEAKLIEELAAECKKEGIPLYVNLTSNLAGKWEKLAP